MDSTENKNAIREVAYGFVPAVYPARLFPVERKPPAKAMMDRFAPNTAALETPSVEGEAIVLFSVVCIISPETERPAPAITAARTRGRRIFRIMRWLAALPLPISAATPSFSDMCEEPIKRQTKAMTTTAITRKMIAVVLCFSVFTFILFTVSG